MATLSIRAFLNSSLPFIASLVIKLTSLSFPISLASSSKLSSLIMVLSMSAKSNFFFLFDKRLEKNKERRSHPSNIWQDAKSVIAVSKNYGPQDNPLHNIKEPLKANISVYARADDYHELMKRSLKKLSIWLLNEYGIESKLFVDTAPIMEKPIAQIAGIGWQGKHSNLVSRKLGSWFFLGVILLPIKLEASSPELDHCGSCSSCIDICPTNAIVSPYKLDSRRCISYLTIEHKGHIPEEFRELIGNRIYGCDDCLAVCPWNKFASQTKDIQLKAKKILNMPDISFFLDFDYDAFNKFFKTSPIKRIGKDRFLRNVLIAAGNSGSQQISIKVKKFLRHESSIIRASAIWALKKIISKKEFQKLRKIYILEENDPLVVSEWG